MEGDDEHGRITKVLSVWDLVQTGTQSLASALLSEAGMSGGQQTDESTEVVQEIPWLLPWRSACEKGSSLAAEASRILEEEGV